MNMKKIIGSLALILLTAGLPAVAFAQAHVPGADQTLLANGPSGVVSLIETITNWVFTILLVLAVLFILFAAFKYLTSGGGEEVGKAHKMLIYAAVAIAVAFLAKGIVFVVAELVTSGNGNVQSNSGNGSLQIQYRGRNVGAGVNIPL